MSTDFGAVPLGAVLPVLFATYDKTNSYSVTMTGLAVTDIEIYKGISTTQRASDNGYTLMDTDGIDVDSVTGIHGFSIDTGDNSDAGFFVAGSFYTVVVASVTVDGGTVNFIAATFRIVAAEATAGTPAVDVKTWNNLTTVALPLVPTTAGRTLDVSATGEAGIDWANVGSPTTTLGLSGTTVKTATDVETDTQDIQGRLPAALTANGNMKSDTLRVSGTVQTARDLGNALPAAAPAANGGLPTVDANNYVAGIQGTLNQLDDLNNISTAQVNTEVDTALSDVGLTTTITGRIDAAITTRATPAQVNAEVVDGLAVDTYAEPAQGAPAATTTLAVKIGHLYKNYRNKKTQTATQWSLFNDDAATIDHKAAVSADETTATKGEVATGP